MYKNINKLMEHTIQQNENFNLFSNLFERNVMKYKEYIQFLKLYNDINKEFVKKVQVLENKVNAKLQCNNSNNDELDKLLATYMNPFCQFIKEQILSMSQVIYSIDEIINNGVMYIEEQVSFAKQMKNDFEDGLYDLNNKYKIVEKTKMEFKNELETIEKYLINYQKFKKQNHLPTNELIVNQNQNQINECNSILNECNEINNLFMLLNKNIKPKYSNDLLSEQENYIEIIIDFMQSLIIKEKKYKNAVKFAKNFEKSFTDRLSNSLNTSFQINKDVMDHFITDICNTFISMNNGLKFFLAYIDTTTPTFVQYKAGEKSNALIQNQFKQNIPFKSIELQPTELQIVTKYINESSTLQTEGNNKAFIDNTYIIGEIPINSIKQIKGINHLNEDNFIFEDMHFVVKTIYSCLKYTASTKYYDVIIEDKKILLNHILNRLLLKHKYLNSNIPTEIITIVSNMLKEESLRHFFLQKLNNLRNKGNFIIETCVFDLIGKYLIEILDVINNSKNDRSDFYSVKCVIILSQTFYIVEKNHNKSNNELNKIYLQKIIHSHSLFKDIKFWETFIDYQIQEEIQLKNNGNENKNKIDNIVFSQLVPISDNMIEFSVPIDQIKQVISSFITKYSLQQEEEAMILSLLNNKEESNNINNTNS